jgi:hypothetical protein
MRLTDGTELTVKPRNPTQGQFAWYDPAIHTASEFSCPSAPIPPALVNELRDGWLDANVWVDGAATGPGSASIGVSVEAYVSDQVTAPDR